MSKAHYILYVPQSGEYYVGGKYGWEYKHDEYFINPVKFTNKATAARELLRLTKNDVGEDIIVKKVKHYGVVFK